MIRFIIGVCVVCFVLACGGDDDSPIMDGEEPAHPLVGSWTIESINGDDMLTFIDEEFGGPDIDIIEYTYTMTFAGDGEVTFNLYVLTEFRDVTKQAKSLGVDKTPQMSFDLVYTASFTVTDNILAITEGDTSVDIELVPIDAWESFAELQGVDVDGLKKLASEFESQASDVDLGIVPSVTWTIQDETLTLHDNVNNETIVLNKGENPKN